MPHPGNSNLYRCFLVWRVANHICRLIIHESVVKRAKLFLLFLLTDSYAASRKHQSLPLFPGVACSKPHLSSSLISYKRPSRILKRSGAGCFEHDTDWLYPLYPFPSFTLTSKWIDFSLAGCTCAAGSFFPSLYDVNPAYRPLVTYRPAPEQTHGH